MHALYLLIPLGLLIVAGAIAALVWAIRHGQFEHLDDAARDSIED